MAEESRSKKTPDAQKSANLLRGGMLAQGSYTEKAPDLRPRVLPSLLSCIERRNPAWSVGFLLFCILLQLCRSRLFTDGTRGVSHTFRDQHVFSPK